MSLIEYSAARRVAAYPGLVFTWAQNGTREKLQKQFDTDNLEVQRKQIGRLYGLFMAELSQNLTKLSNPSGDKALRYLIAVEEIFANAELNHQVLLTWVDGLLPQIDSERAGSRQGMSRSEIAWLKIRNGLKPTDLPLNKTERDLLGAFYTIATGAFGYVRNAASEVKLQMAVLLPTTPKGKRTPKTVTPPSDPWSSILSNGFTLPDLNKLLLYVGIIDEETSTVRKNAGSAWTGVIGLLIETDRFATSNYSLIHRAIESQYGDGAVSKSVIRTYDSTMEKARVAYCSAEEFLNKK